MKRLIAVLIALVLAVTYQPQVAYAVTTVTFDISKGSVNITASSYSGYNSSGTHLSGTSSGKVFTITGSTATNTVTVSGTQNVTISNCSINLSSTGSSSDPGDAAFSIVANNTGNVNVTLVGENTLKSGYARAGLEKNGDTSTGNLIISGTGSLTATGGNCGAGIGGGGRGGHASNITIRGGTITATGSQSAAGIGGGYYGHGSNIAISGGTITAKSGQGAAGIGGGAWGNGSYITISSSTVTATSGGNGAGIGGGAYKSGSNITIINSTVTANGTDYGAGIGGGSNDGSGQNITINGGSVKVTSGISSTIPVIGGSSSGTEVTPINSAGNKVYLIVVANPDKENVKIDGMAYTPTNHSATDTNLYVYLTGTTHTIQVGSKSYVYNFDNNAKHFTELLVQAVNSTDTLVKGTDYTYTNSVLTVKTSKPIKISNKYPITFHRIKVESGVSANITLDSVDIDVSFLKHAAAFEIEKESTGNVTVILASGSVNTLKSGYYCAGLHRDTYHPETIGKLIITGTGSLNAIGGDNGVGIGSGSGDASNITISGGTVTAIGGYQAAGIGGGSVSGASNITISGGTVIATGGKQGAGIGSGYWDDASNITISGGKVIATGGEDAAGIGGGRKGNASNITISGGAVTATGGYWGAGIGSGYNYDASNIIISGGTVTATGGYYSAGIGGGKNGDCSDVTITGGSVRAIAGLVCDNNIGSGTDSTVVTSITNDANNVYCLPIPNPNSTGVAIDGVSYTPVNHKAVDSSDTNLYAYVTSGVHVVTTSSTTQTYTHVLDMSAWYTPPTAATINYGQSLSSSAIQSIVISEDGSSVSGTWSWKSPTTKPSSAGTFTYTAKFTKTS